jgi:hypothetical protein
MDDESKLARVATAAVTENVTPAAPALVVPASLNVATLPVDVTAIEGAAPLVCTSKECVVVGPSKILHIPPLVANVEYATTLTTVLAGVCTRTMQL